MCLSKSQVSPPEQALTLVVADLGLPATSKETALRGHFGIGLRA